MSTKNMLWHIVLSGLFLMNFNSAFAATELIKNGSFENYTITKDKGKWKLVNFDDWVGAGEVWTQALGKAATDGVHKIELDTDTESNALSQTVSTVAATQYQLSLDAYARKNNSSDFEILVDGVVLATISPDRKWAEYRVYFIGTGTDQVITLRELAAQNDSRGTIIDNVSLQVSNELIKNGSFENFSVNQDNGRWKLVTFANWDGAGEAWANTLGKRATQGIYKLELDVANGVDSLSQTVNTTEGLEYQLSLDAYARNKKSSDFEVWVDDSKLDTITPDKGQWKRYSFTFFGKGAAQKIQLKEVESQNNSRGTLIDNVSLISTGNRTNSAPTISGTPLAQINSDESYTFTPSSQDADSDTLRFSITNKPAWASFDTTTGTLTGTPSASDVGTTADILISVHDESLQADLAPFSIEVVKTIQPITNVEDALNSGDASAVTASELLVQAREEIAHLRSGNTLLNDLYKSEAIAYDASNRSQLINIKGDLRQIFPIIYGNKGKTLAAAGTKENSRFAAFGAAPMEHFQAGNNLAYQPQFKRLLTWLITGQASDATALSNNRTIALSFTKSDHNDIKNWLAANYANWTIKECDDVASLASCYSGVDLIITGWQTDNSHASSVRQTLESVVNTGTAVLYLHTWYEAYNDVAHTIADLFGFALPDGGNYWAKDAANWDNVAAMQTASFSGLGYEPIDQVLAHFQNNDYVLDWSGCDDSGEGNNCPYADAFGTAGSTLRNMITALDASKTTLFPNDHYRLQKLLILLGDKYRQEVVYPMDKVSSDDNAFFKSLYADTTVYNYRSINPAQKDMGNFSRSDFSHITPHSKTVNLISKKNFRSTGVYALAGQTFQVTRTDNSAVKTKVFINTLRSGATHEFEKNGYKRPKYLKTVAFEIAAGETLQLTSPYGGTVQISFDTNDLPVSFNFSHIGEHPYWASSADDASFTQKLDAGDFDWAEVVTSGFEVHSKLDKMRESVADAKWGTAQALANATARYMSNFPHVLAGFKGPGIDIVPEIHDFAASKNLTVHNLDLVKHMNADQATCGYGCSGNPYDAYWSYSPIGHGDVHELGHGLEKSRFRFEGWEGHSTTNPYSYYSKSKYHESTNGDPSCQNLPFKQVFEILQASVTDDDPVTYMQNHLWASSGWSQQFMVTLQAMMQAQNLGKLENGWHLLARLHLLEREVNTVKADWDAKKASLGFDQYSLDEFNAMRKNDWMLVSLSFAAGLDYRDYLTMMGIEYSQQAAAQVASFNYPMVPKTFFVSTPNGYCKTDVYGSFLNKSSLAVDGKSVFPE